MHTLLLRYPERYKSVVNDHPILSTRSRSDNLNMDDKSALNWPLPSKPLAYVSNVAEDDHETSDMDMKAFFREEAHNASAAARDEAAMRAMGRRQLLERRYGFISMVGLTTTMMANCMNALLLFDMSCYDYNSNVHTNIQVLRGGGSSQYPCWTPKWRQYKPCLRLHSSLPWNPSNSILSGRVS